VGLEGLRLQSCLLPPHPKMTPVSRPDHLDSHFYGKQPTPVSFNTFIALSLLRKMLL
jgi:hypothetical protein